MPPKGLATGMLIAMSGITLLCAMDAVAKALGAHVGTPFVVFVRYTGAALVLALYLAAFRQPWPRRENFGRHAVRGALMGATAFLFFFAVTRLPLAVVAALAMTAPLYITGMSVLLLKERAHRLIFVALAFGLAGSAVIGFGGEMLEVSGEFEPLAWAAAVLAPVAYAGAIVLLKHHSSDEGAPQMTLAQSLAAALVAVPFLIPTFEWPPTETYPMVFGVGFLGAMGYLLLITGLRRIPASIFAILDYTGLLWAALFGYIFFAELPPLQVWIGGGLIIVACVIGTQASRRVTAVAAA
ncbi:EamA family transporter [Devosia sp. 2618]|uniref:DMT family transporter n=1 Tax=Devosia sp. 2618 TaxID=3156454 RepID=UPI0033917E5A